MPSSGIPLRAWPMVLHEVSLYLKMCLWWLAWFVSLNSIPFWCHWLRLMSWKRGQLIPITSLLSAVPWPGVLMDRLKGPGILMKPDCKGFPFTLAATHCYLVHKSLQAWHWFGYLMDKTPFRHLISEQGGFIHIAHFLGQVIFFHIQLT